MSVLAWILSAIFPLCGTYGASGITPPGHVDFTHLQLQGHSEFLAAPARFSPAPNLVTPIYNVTPSVLFDDLAQVAASEPRRFSLGRDASGLQIAFVIRSPAANFPDILEAAVVPAPGGKAGLILYSRSIYGESDYGKNHDHIITLLTDLNRKVSP
ncbi:MAG: hypothetical protein B7Z75_03215 [Acidocella sp. 20-57-95]|nr:MAG: hypothetical protein B7Z75_03215 [Acidocella sp. 20-57-95]OYV58073.1 MAG: hypothetical protein B7Z71_11175 [Acidocella sp. 21-58-7]HQT64748.1 DUF1499 domain-containing protein [Acidocella sp.]HQU05310.1 DUF1499 domain-containing protein [Acidocella sp.]